MYAQLDYCHRICRDGLSIRCLMGYTALMLRFLTLCPEIADTQIEANVARLDQSLSLMEAQPSASKM